MRHHKPKEHSSFNWLNATQFLGALNDNLFKLLLILFFIGHAGEDAASRVTATAGAIFVVPFLAFSPLAGRLADRFSKKRIIVAAKGAEVAIMALGALCFIGQSIFGLYLTLGLMATQSALFGPAKYGIVPELVEQRDLSRANARLEALTYLAIIAGTALAPALPSLTRGSYAAAAMVSTAIALAGLLASLAIRTTPGGTRRPGSLRATLALLSKDRELLLAVLGAAWFMLLAAFFQLNLIPYGLQTLGLDAQQSGSLFLVAALGIGLGSLLAGRLCGDGIEFGIVPLGTLGLTLACTLLASFSGSLTAALGAIGLLGLASGLIVVPLHAFIQMRAPAERRGEILAATNLASWTGVLLASALLYLLSGPLAFSARQGFMVIGLLTLALTLAAFRVLPDFLLRFLGVLFTRLCYRVRITGKAGLPIEGGALLVANHVSWVDALILLACGQRRIRFIMERSIFNTRFVRPLFQLMGVIPISSGDGRKAMVASLRQARQALDDGFLVCIFAEGALTRNGQLNPFKAGLESIVRGSSHPIIPVHLGGLWGSIFSYRNGRPLGRLPSQIPYPASVAFGAPLPADTPAAQVHQAVTELSAGLPGRTESLGRALVRSARRNWNRRAMADTGGNKYSYGQALTAALLLGERLKQATVGQQRVGILLPASTAGALTNLAITLAGKVPVNLNFTASPEALKSAIEQCDIGTIVTSRAFLEKLELPELCGLLPLEEVMTRIGPIDKLRAWLKARLAPARLFNAPADAEATIIFSSGSTGDPKGVILTHGNIITNIEAMASVMRLTPQDNLCAALPFFHSLGFSGTLWLPLLSGFSASYHSSPLDGAKIAEVVRNHRSTLLLATPTFLLGYLRRAKPEDFASLRLVVTGAEKLKERVADAFEKKFGLRPLEGYGATELAPVAALSVPDTHIGGVRQIGAKAGSVGRPLPGIAVRIVDPETGSALPPGNDGLILVKGSNVMASYLNRPEATAEVLRDGWYRTGDLGHVDNEGFLFITDRLARFSKIGGEMVPHLAVEETLLAAISSTEPAIAVTAIPDEKKGEKLVVIHTPVAGALETLRRTLECSSLPNLWRPNRDAYIEVDELPLLGSGKLDLGRLRKIAIERLPPVVAT